MYAAQAQLIPIGDAARGQAQVRLDGTLGARAPTQAAPFTVGEGCGRIPRGAAPAALSGAIGAASDYAGGDKSAWRGPRDLGGRVFACWDKDALTVRVDATDDSVVPAPPGTAPWDSDAVEVFLDGRDPAFQHQSDPGAGRYQIGVSPADPPVVQVNGKTPPAGLTASAARTPSGYRVTVGAPLTPENFPAGGFRAGGVVKLAVLLDDKDDPQARTRKAVFGWGVSPGGANYADTSGWKTLTLADKP